MLKIGKNTKVWKPCNLYECSIGRNCIISTFAEIQRDVKIGDNCKIEMGAFIPSGVTLGDGVFVGPNVVFINDRFPRAVNIDGSLKSGKDWECIKTVVEAGVSIGANSTILCGINIGEWSMIGAGSLVTKDVPCYTLVMGSPAKVIHLINKDGTKRNVKEVNLSLLRKE